MGRLASAFTLTLGFAAAAAAQVSEYEARYGPTIEVSVDSLIDMPEQYQGKAVRTRGPFEMVMTGSSTQLQYGLRGTFGGYLYIIPRQEIAFNYEQEARKWGGREVEVSGSIETGRNPNTGMQQTYIYIWGYLGPPDDRAKKVDSPEATLEEVVTKAERFDGKTVSVRGQFRGENLFGDLPSSSRQKSSDWVIKDDVFAAWVTGRKAKGSGWSLDASLKRDTGKWLQVTGRVRASRGVVTIEAVEVALAKPAAARVAEAEPKPEPTPPPPPKPRRPPMVAFSLPIDGEREVPSDTVFQVQFSQDMDEASLKERVLLRYAGRTLPGDNALDAVKFSYDGGLRTLRIDPGDLLRPGRVVEIVLLPGIVDLDGRPLETRPGVRAGSATDVLRFQVFSPGLAGAGR
jgi:hypothetical protein